MLTWQDHRWHCDGRPIHAGALMEYLCPDNSWLPVRIESEDRGRVLVAYFTYRGMPLRLQVFEKNDQLRWPRSER
jgi:hypothetical protein